MEMEFRVFNRGGFDKSYGGGENWRISSLLDLLNYPILKENRKLFTIQALTLSLLRRDWSPSVSWACLTGTAQIAICWLILYQVTHEKRYRDGAYTVNLYVRRSMCIDGSAGTRGVIKGSFPVNGHFGACEYLNWVCKFLSIAIFSNPKSVPARVKFVKLINHFNKVSNIKFEKTRASIARKDCYVYSLSQKGG